MLYGVSMAMMVRGGLGLDPWDVFHYGVASGIPLSFGGVVIVTGVAVLLLWIPLRQMPGLGTVANAVLIGLATDAALAVLVSPEAFAGRLGLLLGGVALNGLATALYIGSQFGPGPRDGLMTGLVRRTGLSVRLVRTSIEVSVVAVGWLLGGVVGAGTVLYALAIGPLVQLCCRGSSSTSSRPTARTCSNGAVRPGPRPAGPARPGECTSEWRPVVSAWWR